MESLLDQLKEVSQEHLLRFYEELDEQQQEQLLSDLRGVNWKEIDLVARQEILTQVEDGIKLKPAAKIDDSLLEKLPESCVEGTTRSDKSVLDSYQEKGLTYIGQGRVAALLLAGGQGTRLGVDYPKGMYDVGLDSGKSLFQLQAQRILSYGKLLKEADIEQSGHIIWYIMTSEATMQRTKGYFAEHNHFGLDKGDVVFFEQGTIPCFGLDGKVLLDTKYKLAKSPDGNGGLYDSLHKKGIIEHMRANNVEFVHVYCVDNILVRVCDPTFVGYCIEKHVDAGAKVVEKISPSEAVGTICKVNGKFRVIEYSEISQEMSERRDEASGKLMFNAGNICDHFFSVSFLESLKEKKLRYHLAFKKIPHLCLESGELVKPVSPNGVKLEKFIFDVFEFTDKFAVWEVKREDEFSPLKNADGTEGSNPTTARKALLRCYQLGFFPFEQSVPT